MHVYIGTLSGTLKLKSAVNKKKSLCQCLHVVDIIYVLHKKSTFDLLGSFDEFIFTELNQTLFSLRSSVWVCSSCLVRVSNLPWAWFLCLHGVASLSRHAAPSLEKSSQPGHTHQDDAAQQIHPSSGNQPCSLRGSIYSFCLSLSVLFFSSGLRHAAAAGLSRLAVCSPPYQLGLLLSDVVQPRRVSFVTKEI